MRAQRILLLDDSKFKENFSGLGKAYIWFYQIPKFLPKDVTAFQKSFNELIEVDGLKSSGKYRWNPWATRNAWKHGATAVEVGQQMYCKLKSGWCWQLVIPSTKQLGMILFTIDEIEQ